jgi:hypothetical protein
MGSLEDLSRLEMAHGIDRQTPMLMLEHAKVAQASLEDLAEKHSCELPAWTELAASLEERRSLARTAVERVIAETMELDDAVFGPISKSDCLEILRSLNDEFIRALDTRRECARTLVLLANAYHEEGYAGSDLIDNALSGAIAQVRKQANLPAAVAADYVAHLAEFCGIRRSSGAERQRRFPDLTAMFKGTSGATFEEIANRLQQTALGLWPEEGRKNE